MFIVADLVSLKESFENVNIIFFTLTMLDMYYTSPQYLSNQFEGFQKLAGFYKQRRIQCGSWSAGFLEASWSGSALFSKQEISSWMW